MRQKVARVVPPPLGQARLGPKPEVELQFPEPVRGLNCSCVIAPNTILIADCFLSLIWRVDLPSGDGKVTAREWLEHDSMATAPNGPFPGQPGVNGVEYASKTITFITRRPPQELFMRVRVDPDSHDAAGEPEFVAGVLLALPDGTVRYPAHRPPK